MKLTGKKALITGGNSGIGLATARLFIAEGALVAITGRDQKTLDEAIAELGSSARCYRVDVTIAEDRKRLFAALAKDFGKLDIVFANAGISGRTPTGSTDEAIFESVIRTNLNAAFFTVNSAAPLLNDNGSIIFSGSVQNYLGQPGVAAYAATKGGLVSMARCIAADLAPRNIRVNVVAPGAIKTPIWKRGPGASASAEDSAKLAKFFSSAVPQGRWGEPEDKSAQFVIQPYVVPANTVRFESPAGLATYCMDWGQGHVAFRSARGNVPCRRSDALAEHVFTSGVPSSGDEKVHMNVYVYNNKRHPLEHEFEAVVEKFEFLP